MLSDLNIKFLVISKVRRFITLVLVSFISLVTFYIGLRLGLPDKYLTVGLVLISLLLYFVGILIEPRIFSLNKESYNKLPNVNDNVVFLINPILLKALRQKNPDLTDKDLITAVNIFQIEIAIHLLAGESLAAVKITQDGEYIVEKL